MDNSKSREESEMLRWLRQGNRRGWITKLRSSSPSCPIISLSDQNADTNGEISKLNQDFLKRFDVFARMKKSSVITLARFE